VIMKKMKHDDALEEIWVIRRKVAKEFDYDPQKAGEYYRRKQKAAGVRIYHREHHLATAK